MCKFLVNFYLLPLVPRKGKFVLFIYYDSWLQKQEIINEKIKNNLLNPTHKIIKNKLESFSTEYLKELDLKTLPVPYF